MNDRPDSGTPGRRGFALPAEGDRYRMLVESIADFAILLLDAEGRIRSWNAGAERITGYREDEIVGQSIAALDPPEALASNAADASLDAARKTGRGEDEGWRVRRDGSRFWANVVLSVLRDDDGQPAGFSCVMRDLTERRRLEQTARESEERFRLLVEGVRDYAIFMLTPEGRIASWNAGAETIKGYKPSEIIGEHFSRFYEPEAIARRWPEHELALAIANGRFEDEGWRVRKDGSRFWANVVITALRDASGRLRGFAKVTRDLTMRRQIEELQRSERRMNDFLAMLAHELRNPLAPMRTALEVMDLAPDDPDKARFARDVLTRQLTHLSRMVDDLLDVGRFTRGKIVLKTLPLDLNAIVRESVDAARPLAEARRHALTLELPDAPTPVHADPTRAAQVIANLLANAIKYTPDGGRIAIAVTHETGSAMLKVADNGEGIAAELLPSVFDPFVQGDRGLDRAQGGLGIGLTLVKRIVELHGGTVAATSPGPGQGSTFTVRLPLATSVAPLEQASPVAGGGPRLRVMVVDDNEDVATSVALLLRMLGHDVEVARDGFAALGRAPAFAPDVVLLDIGLPRMNGYDVARGLRALPALRSATLVACTGYGRDEDRQNALQAGFDRHAVKPVGVDVLKDILSEAANRRSR